MVVNKYDILLIADTPEGFQQAVVAVWSVEKEGKVMNTEKIK